jgi:hypothetical protein
MRAEDKWLAGYEKSEEVEKRGKRRGSKEISPERKTPPALIHTCKRTWPTSIGGLTEGPPSAHC